MDSDKTHTEFLEWLSPKQLKAYHFAKKQLNDTFDCNKFSVVKLTKGEEVTES